MEIVIKIAPIILALIMLGLGLGLKIKDFTRVIKTPRDFFIGFISQLIILPLVAYLLILILKTPPRDSNWSNDNSCSPWRGYLKHSNKICKW
jgi:BASS family bile acid:Na+ symporter